MNGRPLNFQRAKATARHYFGPATRIERRKDPADGVHRWAIVLPAERDGKPADPIVAGYGATYEAAIGAALQTLERWKAAAARLASAEEKEKEAK